MTDPRIIPILDPTPTEAEWAEARRLALCLVKSADDMVIVARPLAMQRAAHRVRIAREMAAFLMTELGNYGEPQSLHCIEKLLAAHDAALAEREGK